MREILFQGKRKDDGTWVYGYFGLFKGRSEIYVPFTEEEEKENEGHFLSAIGGLWHEVIHETVGQYTGLTDKNGKKIFEGDIVQYYGTYALEVFIENGHVKIRWFDTVTNGEYDELFFGFDESLGECEVIGNIHDNLELLKGGAEDGK